MAASILPLPKGSSSKPTKTRPSYKARKTSNSGFVVTSRPVKSDSGDLDSWTQVDVQAGLVSERSNGTERMPANANTLGKGSESEVSTTAANVKDTDRIQLAWDSKGRRMVNQYVRLHEIGRGSHGRVWLCEEISLETGEHVAYYAVKEVHREDQQRNLKKAQKEAHGAGFLGFGPAVQPESAYQLSSMLQNKKNSDDGQSKKDSDDGQSKNLAERSRPTSLASIPTTPTAAQPSPSAFALSKELHRSSIAQHCIEQSGRGDAITSHSDPLKTPMRRPDQEPLWPVPSTTGNDLEYEGSDLSSIRPREEALVGSPNMPRSQGRSGDIADMQRGLVPDEEMQGSYGLAGIGRQRSIRRPMRSAFHMDEKVRQEIAIMKRCNHKHVVGLKEVINDPQSKKIFMVLEYMAGGQLSYQRSDASGEPCMTVDQSRQIFRDVLLGLDYLHYQGIIHRDIKPANLLWTDDSHTCVKISDFGVSHVSEMLVESGSRPHDDALRTTVGSPAFFAPELCALSEMAMPTPENTATTPASGRGIDMSHYFGTLPESESVTSLGRAVATISHPVANARQVGKTHGAPPIGKALDVWALGVTLYALLFGRPPFTAETEYRLYNVIPTQSVPVPACMGLDRKPVQSEEGRELVDLLDRLLCKDPTKRISVAEAKKHPWTLRNLTGAADWLTRNDPARAPALTVTTEEVQQATADRTRALDSARTGIKGSFKRAFSKFGNAVGVKSRRRSASSLGTSIAEPSESSQSQPASRHPSATRKTLTSQPVETSNSNTNVSRQWSLKKGRNGTPDNSGSPKAMFLTRTISGSSAASASVLSFGRRPSDHTPSRLHEALRVDTDDRSQSPMTPASPSLDAEHDSRTWLTRRVWDKLRPGNRTPTIDASVRSWRQDSSQEIANVLSPTAMDEDHREMPDYAAAAAEVLDRSDFDAFGRQRPREVQQDEFSDDSLSELDYQHSPSGFQYNDGEGWQFSAGQQEPQQEDAESENEENNEKPHPWPDARLFNTDTLPPEDEHAIYSSEDADAEHGSDRAEDDDGLELNFSRRRRPTNGSSANNSTPTSRSGTPGRP